ncbi:MAG TPA: hypothetical protein VHO26_08225 [Propionibacteriaceae bacterium]|nr:hypothetical protein [Propionibacteriaceae bacterium]
MPCDPHTAPRPLTDLSALALSTSWVESAPFRTHLGRLLAETGETPRVLALAAGVAPGTVHTLLAAGPRRRRLRARDAAHVIALDRLRLAELAATPVAAHSTRRRVGALESLGYGPTWLGAHLRLDAEGIDRLMSADSCSALMALRAAGACGAAGLSGWWSGDGWFDDVRTPGRRCTTPMRDWAA